MKPSLTTITQDVHALVRDGKDQAVELVYGHIKWTGTEYVFQPSLPQGAMYDMQFFRDLVRIMEDLTRDRPAGMVSSMVAARNPKDYHLPQGCVYYRSPGPVRLFKPGQVTQAEVRRTPSPYEPRKALKPT